MAYTTACTNVQDVITVVKRSAEIIPTARVAAMLWHTFGHPLSLNWV